MISWRYHLISIVAVFLALGLGILTGTTVLNDSLVRGLRGQTRQLQSQLSSLRSSVDEARSQLGTMNAFAEQAMPYMVASTLSGQQVILVTEEGVDTVALGQTRTVLDLAGATRLTTLTVHPSVAAQSSASRQQLASLLGMAPGATPQELETAAARALADRLSRDPRADLSGDPDLLGQLLSQGFLTAAAPGLSDATLAGIGGRGQLVVTIGGASTQLSPPSSAFLVPLVDRLVTLGVITGAGESTASQDGFITDVRSSSNDAGGPLVTVDNADSAIGASALALGLRVVIQGGPGGDYGSKTGASGLLPPPA